MSGCCLPAWQKKTPRKPRIDVGNKRGRRLRVAAAAPANRSSTDTPVTHSPGENKAGTDGKMRPEHALFQEVDLMERQ